MEIGISIKQRLFQIAEIIHLRVFGHAMSDEMRKFLSNLSWSFFGGIVAAGIMFAVNILAGRWLGPEEYGRYNAILSFATILSTLYLFGMDTSSVRYLSDKKFEDSSKKIFTTTLSFVLFVQLVVTILLLIGRELFPNHLVISETFLSFGIFLAVVISLKALMNGFLRAFHEYEKQSLYRIIDAVIVLLAFVAVVFFGQRPIASSYALSFAFGGSMFIVFSLWLLRKNFSLFDVSIFKKIFIEYNRYVLVMSLIGMVLVSDKLIIGKFLGLEMLGYYSAYYVASHLFVAELGGIFMNVFWPSVIKNTESMIELVKKTTKLFIYFSPAWILLISLSTSVLFSFFGKEYPIHYDYIILFSVNTFLGFLLSVFIGFLSIHHIQKSILISFLFVLFSIATLILTKNITWYLSAQILSQIVFICLARIFLLNRVWMRV